MTPLFESYMKALERERKAAMREDDLEGALAYSKEKKRASEILKRMIKHGNYTRGDRSASKQEPDKEGVRNAVISESNLAAKRPVAKKPSIVKLGKPAFKTWHGAKAMKADSPWSAVYFTGQVEGNTKGKVELELPNKKRAVIYSWTGKEREFRSIGKTIYDGDQLPRIQIDISEFTTEAGPYSLHFTATGGDGTFYLYSGRMMFKAK